MKKQSKKTRSQSSDYIIVDGVRYEKVSAQSVEVELDLHEDTLNAIDKLISSGRYISRGDAIRDILRQAIDKNTTSSKK